MVTYKSFIVTNPLCVGVFFNQLLISLTLNIYVIYKDHIGNKFLTLMGHSVFYICKFLVKSTFVNITFGYLASVVGQSIKCILFRGICLIFLYLKL